MSSEKDDSKRQRYSPISTEIGIIGVEGRGTVDPDTITFDVLTHSLELLGFIDGGDVSAAPTPPKNYPFHLVFHSVVVYRVVELDTWEHNYPIPADEEVGSSFDEIINSEWIESLRRGKPQAYPGYKIKAEHRHFYLDTYDYVLEVIAEGYEMKVDVE